MRCVEFLEVDIRRGIVGRREHVFCMRLLVFGVSSALWPTQVFSATVFIFGLIIAPDPLGTPEIVLVSNKVSEGGSWAAVKLSSTFAYDQTTSLDVIESPEAVERETLQTRERKPSRQTQTAACVESLQFGEMSDSHGLVCVQ